MVTVKKEPPNPSAVSSEEDEDYVKVYHDDEVIELQLTDDKLLLSDLEVNFPGFHGLRMEASYGKHMVRREGSYLLRPKRGWKPGKLIALTLRNDVPSTSARNTPINEAPSSSNQNEPQTSVTPVPSLPILSDEDLCKRFHVTTMSQLLQLSQFSYKNSVNNLSCNMDSFMKYRNEYLKVYRGTVFRLGPETFNLGFLFEVSQKAVDVYRLLNCLKMEKMVRCDLCKIDLADTVSTLQHYCSIAHGQNHITSKGTEAMEIVDISKCAKESLIFPPPFCVTNVPVPLMSVHVPTPPLGNLLIHQPTMMIRPLQPQRRSLRWDQIPDGVFHRPSRPPEIRGFPLKDIPALQNQVNDLQKSGNIVQQPANPFAVFEKRPHRQVLLIPTSVPSPRVLDRRNPNDNISSCAPVVPGNVAITQDDARTQPFQTAAYEERSSVLSRDARENPRQTAAYEERSSVISRDARVDSRQKDANEERPRSSAVSRDSRRNPSPTVVNEERPRSSTVSRDARVNPRQKDANEERPRSSIASRDSRRNSSNASAIEERPRSSAASRDLQTNQEKISNKRTYGGNSDKNATKSNQVSKSPVISEPPNKKSRISTSSVAATRGRRDTVSSLPSAEPQSRNISKATSSAKNLPKAAEKISTSQNLKKSKPTEPAKKSSSEEEEDSADDFEVIAVRRRIKGEFGDDNVGRECQPNEKELLFRFKCKSFSDLEKLECMNVPYKLKDFPDFLKFRQFAFQRLRKLLINAPMSQRIMYNLFLFSKSKVAVKTIIKTAKKKCSMCSEDFTLEHLLSQKHLIWYRDKYFCDPEEIAEILKVENQPYYIGNDDRALVLRNLECDSFEALKNTHQFNRNNFYLNNSQNFEALKEALIERLKNTDLNIPKSFSLEKMLFFKYEACRDDKTFRPFRKIFENCTNGCRCCKLEFPSSRLYFKHIVSKQHIRKELTPSQMTKIIRAMNMVRLSDDGFIVMNYESDSSDEEVRNQNADSSGEDSAPEDPTNESNLNSKKM